MPKRVLDVGNCGPDHMSMRRFLTRHFACEVQQAHGLVDTLEALRSSAFDLVLVNRKLDQDYSNGIEVIRALKTDPQLQSIPVMMVTNYGDHQDAAVAVGAVRGFGKLEFEKPETVEKLRPWLG